MMRAILILPLLAGCTPHLVASNEAGGIVNTTGSINGQRKAMEQANAECRKYGKVALSKGINLLTNTFRYECVKP